jgi:hypothetical protein
MEMRSPVGLIQGLNIQLPARPEDIFNKRARQGHHHVENTISFRGLNSPRARQSNGERKFGPVPGFISGSLLGSGGRKLCLGI